MQQVTPSLRGMWRGWWARLARANAWWVRTALTACCVLAVLAHVQGIWHIPGMAALERSLYDWRLRWMMQPQAESRVVIVDIDEASLAQEGRWPWPRAKVAQMLEALVSRHGAQTVAFDMVFAEPSLAPRWGASTDDDRLVKAVAHAPVVLGYYLSSDRGGARYGNLPDPVWRSQAGEPMPQVTEWSGYGANLSALAQGAPAGFFNSITDDDGLVRRLPLLAEVDGSLYESLALSAYRRWAGLSQLALLRAPHDVDPSGRRIQSLLLTGNQTSQRVAVDALAAAWVNYRQPSGPGGAFTYISAADVLNPAASLPDLQGKLVLVGTSAPGLQDVRATPVASIYPGVEAHASLIADLMQHTVSAPPPEALAWSWAMVVAVGVALAVFLPRAAPWRALLVAALGAFGVMSLAWWAQATQGWIVSIAPTIALMAAALLLNMAYGFVSERRMRQLTEWFGSYLPRTLVREMVANRESVDMRADYRELTVLFCDIRGFTGIAEQLSPAQLQALLNQVLSRLTDCVAQSRGTLDKYMGDSVMAFWGAPVAAPDHAARAVQCAQAMLQAVKTLNPELQRQGLPQVRVGVGIATGEMFVGDMGSTRRRTYTVIGDTVNVAARLEELTKTESFNILANEATARAVPQAEWQTLQVLAVRGRQQRQAVYGLSPNRARD